MALRVDCRQDDPRAEPEPHVVWFGNRPVHVLSIVDRWWGARQRWWKVDTAEGAYVLRLDQDTATWELAAVVRA